MTSPDSKSCIIFSEVRAGEFEPIVLFSIDIRIGRGTEITTAEDVTATEAALMTRITHRGMDTFDFACL
jgi:hypothetical protein